MPRPDTGFWLDFIFPNLWQNHLGDSSRVVIAFVPVDDENYLLYLRFYQKFVRDARAARHRQPAFDADQCHDRPSGSRVVQTQHPKRSDLRMGEKLIQGDSPIIAYRRRRQELIEAASGKTAEIA